MNELNQDTKLKLFDICEHYGIAVKDDYDEFIIGNASYKNITIYSEKNICYTSPDDIRHDLESDDEECVASWLEDLGADTVESVTDEMINRYVAEKGQPELLDDSTIVENFARRIVYTLLSLTNIEDIEIEEDDEYDEDYYYDGYETLEDKTAGSLIRLFMEAGSAEDAIQIFDRKIEDLNREYGVVYLETETQRL